MKHSDIQVTVSTQTQKEFFHHIRKVFFLAGYLALMAVATGVASPKPAEDPIAITGLNPLDSWPSPLLMKCDDSPRIGPLRSTDASPRFCKVENRVAQSDVLNKQTQE